jgi:hypothetical protein
VVSPIFFLSDFGVKGDESNKSSLSKVSRRPISNWASLRLLYNHFAGHIRMD